MNPRDLVTAHLGLLLGALIVLMAPIGDLYKVAMLLGAYVMQRLWLPRE